MVTIVIGKINDNKTTTMINLYEARHEGDGYVALKHMIQDTVHSYDALKLSTKTKKLLIKRDVFFEDDFTVCCKLGPYVFSDETMAMIKDDMISMADKKVSPLYLDEIGVLELEGKGFDALIKHLCEQPVDLVLSMREDLVDDVIKRYKFKDVQIIKSSVKRTDIDV